MFSDLFHVINITTSFIFVWIRQSRSELTHLCYVWKVCLLLFLIIDLFYFSFDRTKLV